MAPSYILDCPEQPTITNLVSAVIALMTMLLIQIAERFSSARKTTMARRDARDGQQVAQPVLKLHRGVAMVIDWDPPLAGHLEDLFTLEGGDGQTLHVRSLMNCEGRTNDTVQVRDQHARLSQSGKSISSSGLLSCPASGVLCHDDMREDQCCAPSMCAGC